MVDEGMIEKDPSWGFTNQDGDTEYVSFYSDEVAHVTDVDVYIKDIPKLILALQAAYNFKFKEST